MLMRIHMFPPPASHPIPLPMLPDGRELPARAFAYGDPLAAVGAGKQNPLARRAACVIPEPLRGALAAPARFEWEYADPNPPRPRCRPAERLTRTLRRAVRGTHRVAATGIGCIAVRLGVGSRHAHATDTYEARAVVCASYHACVPRRGRGTRLSTRVGHCRGRLWDYLAAARLTREATLRLPTATRQSTASRISASRSGACRVHTYDAVGADGVACAY